MLVAAGVHHFNTNPFNWYLIEEAGRLTLVDAGFPGHYRVFSDGIRSIGHEIKDVDAIILTHAHADHMGFADRVSKEANAPVYIHRADLDASARILQLPWWGLLSRVWRPFTASMLARGIRNGVFSRFPVEKALTFEDADVLDVPGRPHVVHLPGHTAGEVAFYLPERGVLISGDALVTRDLYSGEFGLPQVPNRPLNDDDTQARRSLSRLADLGPITLLPGHGKPWQGNIDDVVKSNHSPY